MGADHDLDAVTPAELKALIEKSYQLVFDKLPPKIKKTILPDGTQNDHRHRRASGAGKSTLGKMLAKKLGLLYLDTGAMYRGGRSRP